ncbi:MAG: aminodeoxychorismate synthase component I [Pyrinomonadaceae bacterium]|nr:aminodeoxychorismate synthase component I [Pyrinomonadaceae bacterium]
MPQLDLTADELVSALLKLSETETVCVLDSCGVGYLDSHLLIAGLGPVEVLEIGGTDPQATLDLLETKMSADRSAIFTISYDFGRKLLNIGPTRRRSVIAEPDVFLALFDSLIVHDYRTGKTTLHGNVDVLAVINTVLRDNISDLEFEISNSSVTVNSNFTKEEYLQAINNIHEQIRCGNTYQTNLTRQMTAKLPAELSPQTIFSRLRRDHPAPFSAFITRPGSTIISASPERFIRVDGRHISTSPIKGTRPRGRNAEKDAALRAELAASEKDRAENTMIVDLLRNDIGRVCEFGSVKVEALCEIEEHPTYFHLVSTINGKLREKTTFSKLLRAVFPCGSITGAPKISTMKIIDEIEPANRGLSMGAIGYYVPEGWQTDLATFDLNVAIRTMVIRDGTATFNVGGGIVIDSEPEREWDETVTKARALMTAIGGGFA